MTATHQWQEHIPTAAVDRYAEQMRTDFNVPGLVVAIVKDDAIVMAKGLRAAPALLESAVGLELKDILVRKKIFLDFHEEQLTRSKSGRTFGQAPLPLLLLLNSLELFVCGSSGTPFCQAFVW